MDLITAIVIIIFILIVVQSIRLAFADGDLSLMWAERFGSKPDILKGEVVWITGASTGIGEYLAYELAKVGCRLVLSARTKELLDAVKKRCLTSGRLNDDDILVLPLNMMDVESHKPAVEEVLKVFGQIDVLVNNAARSQRAWAIETELSVDQEMIQLNVIGPVSLTKSVLPHMVKRQKGHIVVTSSLAGKGGVPFSATYCLTKFAVNGWFQSLAVEMSNNNIPVTIVCPGPVVSNLSNIAFVAKSGETYNGSQDGDTKRMSTERCAELMAIAIANKLDEVWISRQPTLMFPYAVQYMPSIANKIIRRLGLKSLMKAREGKI